MNHSQYCSLSNSQRRRFHAMGGVKPLSEKEKRARFKETEHRCPTRYEMSFQRKRSYAMSFQRKRSYAPNYMLPWRKCDDSLLLRLQRQGKSLKEVCKRMGRNPNGIVLRTVVLAVKPVFSGKEYRGRFYEEVFNKHYGF